MRILLVNYEFPPVGGGAGRASWHLCQELSNLEISVDVVTSQGQRNSDYTLGGASIYLVPIHRKSIHETGMLGMLEFLLKAFFLLRTLVRKNHYDLIHYFFSVPTGLLSFFAGRSLPFIVSLRGGDVPGYNPGELQAMHKLLMPANRFVWRKASAVVALSNDLRTHVCRIEPGLECQVIFNGVDTDLFQPLSDIKKNKTFPVRILSVGRLLELKGIQYLLEALTRIENGTFHYSIVGTGYFESALRRQVVDLNLQESVTFLGPKSHNALLRMYNDADIFALPSYGDSFGQVFTEAMACGLPIIAARSGGVQEFVEDGVNGFLVKPQNADALVSPLRRLIHDASLREKMGKENFAKMRREFSWEAVANQYISVYKHLEK